MTNMINDDKALHEKEGKKALLVSVYRKSADKEICLEHLDELHLLAETYKVAVLHKFPCLVRNIDARTFVSKGKLEEIFKLAEAYQPNLIIFDDEISPAQQRNLESYFKIPVVDRTEVILGVFAQRAQTKEAQLQIELAQTKYQAPRLKRLWTHLSRQQGTGGGGVYLKGEGEKQIEIDRRILKRKIDLLQKEIEVVRNHRETQRTARQRSEIPVLAIIGYTNAGKSTLLNALTNADVLVEDKLFATLDTTTRKFTLPNNQEILLIDTVGFIRKLPHLLVAAFRSTLEEAIQADILIHLIDVSHPMALEQADASLEVLKELGAENKPVITVLNKIDRCDSPALSNRFRIKFPKTVSISALESYGFDELLDLMIQELSKARKIVKMRIPQSEYAVVSEILKLGHVQNKDYEENDVILQVNLPSSVVSKYAKFVI